MHTNTHPILFVKRVYLPKSYIVHVHIHLTQHKIFSVHCLYIFRVVHFFTILFFVFSFQKIVVFAVFRYRAFPSVRTLTHKQTLSLGFHEFSNSFSLFIVFFLMDGMELNAMPKWLVLLLLYPLLYHIRMLFMCVSIHSVLVQFQIDALYMKTRISTYRSMEIWFFRSEVGIDFC